MRIKIHKNKVAWLLMGGLILGTLGGCQKKTAGDVKETTIQAESGGKGEIKTPDQESTEPKAMGRYVETAVELPKETEEQMWCWFGRGADGNLELYTTSGDYYSEGLNEVFRYVYRNGVWEKDEDWVGNAAFKAQGIDPMFVTYGQDGNYYLGGTDQDYRYHIFRLNEDGTTTEQLAGCFEPEEGKDYGMIPAKFQVLEDGKILVFDYWQVLLYDAEGKRLLSMAKDFSGTTSDARGFLDGKELVTVLDNQIVRYDLQSGKVTDTISVDEVEGVRSVAELFGDGAGGIYMATETGLSHINKGGTLWEILIDGSLNHMGMRSLYMTGFLEGDHEDYYGTFGNEGGKGILMFHYEYDPNMAAVPPSGITVYSLKDSSTVRQAASQFQSQYPDVRVEVRTAVEDGGNVTEEMIQGLNTELLSGKGADILILDGLPAESYIEKGVLMDMRDLVEEMEGTGQMYDHLLNGFKEEDGAVYQVPARFSFPLLIGEERAVEAYSDLESMAGYQGEKPLVPVSNYENLLRMTARLCYKELFAGEMGLADREKLIRYLETVKTVGEANGAKTTFSEEEMEMLWTSNNVAEDGITGSGVCYDAGKNDSSVVKMDGFMMLSIPVEVRKLHPGTLMVPAGDLYLPSTVAAINRSTANEELAKEFIRCLLSYEVQKEELYDGLPVNKKAMETNVETEKDGFSIGSGIGDYYINGEYPAKEVRQEVAAMIDGLTVPVVIDETMMKMVVDGSRDYFDGKEDVQQAADRILRTMSIYLSE